MAKTAQAEPEGEGATPMDEDKKDAAGDAKVLHFTIANFY